MVYFTVITVVVGNVVPSTAFYSIPCTLCKTAGSQTKRYPPEVPIFTRAAACFLQHRDVQYTLCTMSKAHHPPPNTPLMSAAASGDIQQVKEICADSAADVEYTNEDGFTALIWACLNGHIDVVRYLVDEKNAAVNMPPNRHTPLRGAGNYGHLEVVQFLLDRGADPNVPSMGGRTPIMGAAMNGYMDVLEAMLEHGADKSAKNDGGETALDLAKLKGHDAVVARLEQ